MSFNVSVTTSRKVYTGVDFMRFFAAILVVGIHTRPFYEWNYQAGFLFEHLLTRIAVPFFFLASGYFFFSKLAKTSDRQLQRAYLFDFLKRIFVLYVLWSILYFPYEFHLLNKEYHSVPKSLAMYVFRFFTWGTHAHLWYVPALVFSTLLIYAFFVRDRFYGLIMVALVLYGIGLLGDSYNDFVKNTWFEVVHQGYLRYFHATRDLIFFGSVFVGIGAVLAKYKPDVSKSNLWALVVLGTIAFLAEVLLLAYLGVTMANMFLSLLLVTPALFLLLLKLELPALAPYSAWFRTLSIGIYYSHLLFLAVIYRFLGYAQLSIDHYATIAFLATFVSAGLFTIVVSKSKIKFLKLLIS